MLNNQRHENIFIKMKVFIISTELNTKILLMCKYFRNLKLTIAKNNSNSKQHFLCIYSVFRLILYHAKLILYADTVFDYGYSSEY